MNTDRAATESRMALTFTVAGPDDPGCTALDLASAGALLGALAAEGAGSPGLAVVPAVEAAVEGAVGAAEVQALKIRVSEASNAPGWPSARAVGGRGMRLLPRIMQTGWSQARTGS